MNESVVKVTAQDGTGLNVRVFAPDTATTPVRDLVLLHGWPNSSRVYRPLAEALVLAMPYRIFAPDFRGYGDSDKPELGYDCATFAADVLTVVQSLALKSFVLAGHSMGGKIAQVTATLLGESLSGLILITPGTLFPPPPADMSVRRAAYGNREATREIASGFAYETLSDEVQTELANEGVQVAHAAWEGWLTRMREEDFSAEVGKIHAPTLVIGGVQDKWRTEESLQSEIVSRIENATYASMPHIGHLPHLEDPFALAALMTNFIDDLPS